LLPGSAQPQETRSKDDAVLEDRRATFCARLKAARERKGISLEDIAASTKISRSLLRGLEASDISRWPQGLYRRSYFRDYLRAIDLPPDSFVAEFVRLFPDEASALVAPSLDAGRGDDPEECALSMTLAEVPPAERFARARTRMMAAAIDALVVLIAAGAAWWAMQADIWTSGTIVALGYYSVGTAALGRSFGSLWLEDRSWRSSKALPSPTAATDTFFARLREAKRLTEQPHPSMMRRLASVAFNAALFRILFFR
jgi:transcriptional regulator with XRE-family HTH domain